MLSPPVDNSRRHNHVWATVAGMTWDALFDDLTEGLESEWEYERAARDAERKRLRVAQTTWHTRLQALVTEREPVAVTLCDARVLSGTLVGFGADWAALSHATAQTLHVLPDHAVLSFIMQPETARASIEAVVSAPNASETRPTLASRMTLGYLARDLARRRVAVTVNAGMAWQQHGTIDRAGVDHLDLAVHERDTPRRSRAIGAMHLVRFEHITSITVEANAAPRV